MFLLMVTSCYTGIELAFFSVVYGTAIGNTSSLVDSDTSPKRFIGLSGILIGVGEIIGGLSFGILGGKTNRLGRDPIVILGYFTHMIAFFLVFINFPKDSPLQQTSEAAYISSSLAIALVCSFLLGFADSCYNTQMYSIIGTVYSENSANAFALFKFFQVRLVRPLTLFWHWPFFIGTWFPFSQLPAPVHSSTLRWQICTFNCAFWRSVPQLARSPLCSWNGKQNEMQLTIYVPIKTNYSSPEALNPSN